MITNRTARSRPVIENEKCAVNYKGIREVVVVGRGQKVDETEVGWEVDDERETAI